MQSSVTCEDKLVKGIDALSTDAINFISKTLASPGELERIPLGIVGNYKLVEVAKLNSEKFLIEAQSLSEGEIKFFEYSEPNGKPKLEPFRPKITSEKKFRDSGLSATSSIDFGLFGLIGPENWLKNPTSSGNTAPTNSGPTSKKDSPCPAGGGDLIDLNKLNSRKPTIK